MASTHGLLSTLGYQIGQQPPVYALEGSIAHAGSLVQWVRDNLGLIEKASDIEALASLVQDNGDVYCVPAFSGLLAPHWRPDARGIIAGLTQYANRSHIARAVIEATAFQARDIVEAMNLDSGVSLKHLKVDGGMIRNNLLMQFQADLLGVPVIRPIVAETTCLGAAYAAGLAVGFWSGIDELTSKGSVHSTWTPHMDEQYRSKVCRGWKKAVERTLNWVDSA